MMINLKKHLVFGKLNKLIESNLNKGKEKYMKEPNKLINEKSRGAVIYKVNKNDKSLSFLILHMNLGHFSLCKGHVEKEDKDEEDTARREIKEETSLDVKIDINFREVITYSPKEGVIKDVIFFIAKDISNIDPKDNYDNEVNKIYYLPFIEAYNLLTYPSDKEVLKKAYEYIINNKLVNN